MTVTGWIQIVVLVAVLTLLTPLLGGYMARVYRRERVGLAYVLGPVERLLYRALRVDAERGAAVGSVRRLAAAVQRGQLDRSYVILRTQRIHPFNPQGFVESAPFLSQAQNNGSAMAGYTGFIQPVPPATWDRTGVAFDDLAGGVGTPRPDSGHCATDTPTFVIYLVGFVVIVAVLTSLTALVLAPFAQALSSRMLG